MINRMTLSNIVFLVLTIVTIAVVLWMGLTCNECKERALECDKTNQTPMVIGGGQLDINLTQTIEPIEIG